jgi:hypothetical protein
MHQRAVEIEEQRGFMQIQSGGRAMRHGKSA